MTPQDHRHLTHAHAPHLSQRTFEETQPGVFRGDMPCPPQVCLIGVSELLQAPSQLTPPTSAPLWLERGRSWAYRHAMSVLLSCSAGAIALLCWTTAQLQTQASTRVVARAPGGSSVVLVAVETQPPPRLR